MANRIHRLLLPWAFLSIAYAPVKAEDAPKEKSSSLDQLEASRIADAVRLDKQPKEIVAIIPEKSGLTFAAVSGECKTLAIAHPSGSVRGWDLTGKEPKTVFLLKRSPMRLHFVALSYDGKRLASTSLPSGEEKKIDPFCLMVWALGEREPKPMILPQIPLPWSDLAFSPKDGILATYTAVPHSAQGFGFLDVSEEKPRIAAYISGPTGHLRFAPNGKTVAISTSKTGNGGVQLYDWTVDAKAPRAIIDNEDHIGSFSFGHDSKTLAIQKDGLVEIWDVATAKPNKRSSFKIAEAGGWMDFARDGKRIAITDPDKKTLAVYTAEGKKVHEWRLPAVPLNVIFSSDSRHLVVACGNVYIFRLEP